MTSVVSRSQAGKPLYMTKVLNLGYYLLIATVVVLGILLLLAETAVLSNVQIKIVQSGSMEPALKTGGVIVVVARDQYQIGDMVTFTERDPRAIPTTHRIVASEITEGELRFTTKGDANDGNDVETTAQSQIIGKVVVHVPFIGYILDFARQPLGFLLMIVLPAALIVFEEVGVMYRLIRPKPESA